MARYESSNPAKGAVRGRGSSSARRVAVFVLLAASCRTSLPAAEPAKVDDGKSYPVSKFDIRYGSEHPDLPPISDLLAVEIPLGKAADGYVAPRAGVEPVTIRLADVPNLPLQRFYATAINAINTALVRHFNDRLKIIGVFVTPDPDDLDLQSGQDLRAGSNTVLREMVWVGVVRQAHSLAAGERVPDTERIDNPVHRRIRELSPIQPGQSDGKHTDILRKDLLDDYIFRMNRYPGRRVDLALSSAGRPGEVCMDYLVSENKPWLAYYQLANTGTPETGKWRQRFGFIHNQVTGNDDTFTLDYVTNLRMDDTHSLLYAYEAPVGRSDWLRWRVQGTYGEYTASDVGVEGQNFSGREVGLGADLIATIYQHRDLFLDLLTGLQWRRLTVTDKMTNFRGREDFLLPHVGLRLERRNELATTSALVQLETNVACLAHTKNDEVKDLGRVGAETRWWLMRWDFSHSFFLEPLLDRQGWEDPGTPESSTLAHEMFFAFRGQKSFGSRLIPQEEDVLGGHYSVRGYAQSEAAGDSTMMGTAEYRFHIPRAFRIPADPDRIKVFGKPFHYAPPYVYGRPDWDLIFRTFMDAGRTWMEHRASYENNQTLLSWGVGLELQIYQNLTIRVDWAQALMDLHGGGTQAGDNRFHIVMTVVY